MPQDYQSGFIGGTAISMSSMNDVRILLLADAEAILAFEKKRVLAAPGDPMELEMRSWTAPWRGEALNHYLPQGWSFGAFKDGELQAYVLGQPLLFYRGLTQTLWIEHVSYADGKSALAVLDVAHRWARDKHLQCVLLENGEDLKPLLKDWPAAQEQSVQLLQAKSARF